MFRSLLPFSALLISVVSASFDVLDVPGSDLVARTFANESSESAVKFGDQHNYWVKTEDGWDLTRSGSQVENARAISLDALFARAEL
jgi:hypothetical protein